MLRLMNIIYVLIAAASTFAIVVWSMAAWSDFQLTSANYHSENKCIAHWVSHGIERRDISRVDGTCIVVKN